MSSQTYSTSLIVEQTPDEAFAAITNVRGWWSGEIEGSTDQLGAEFSYRYQDVHYSTQRITRLVPGRKVVWHILDAYLNLAGRNKTPVLLALLEHISPLVNRY